MLMSLFERNLDPKTLKSVIGIDAYPCELLRIAEQVFDKLSTRKNHAFVRGDIQCLPCSSDVSDLCTCLGVLEHVRTSKKPYSRSNGLLNAMSFL